jgi:nucleoside-diphosphate-sugar epimerase
MKKVLLLGSGGFIGSNLLRELSYSKGLHIVAPRRSELDLLDTKAVDRFFRQYEFNVIVHSAIDVSDVEASIKMSLNVIRSAPISAQYLQIGSGAEYDRFGCPPDVTEEAYGERIPSDDYGISKFLIAQVLNQYRPTKTLNLRVFGVFGSIEEERRLIPSLVKSAILKQECALKQDALFSFVPIQDLSRFVTEWVNDRDPTYGAYNFVGEKPILLSDIMKIIAREIEQTRTVIVNAGMQSPYYGSNKNFCKDFPTFRFSDTSQAIREYINHLKATFV